MVAHHTRDMDHSSPAAADGHHSAWIRHPLDPLDAGEIRRAVEILRREQPVSPDARFVSVSLNEPPKDQVAFATPDGPAPGQATDAGPDAAVPREAFVVLLEPRQHAIYEAVVSLTTGSLLSWTLLFHREQPDDNPYAKPIHGLHAVVDYDDMTVVRVEDLGVVPVPPGSGAYAAHRVGPLRDDLKPLEITQPEGPSFDVRGWEVRWQRWRFRVGFTPREGLVLHTVGYEDQGRVDLADGNGEPYTIRQAICLHEEDAGLLWKHYDGNLGTTETRRSRRLVISFILTADNYEYAIYWYFYQDGSIEFEVKLTGVVLTSALPPGETSDFGTLVAPQTLAAHHQHFLSARLDMAVDGLSNTVYEVDTEAVPPGPGNPLGNAFRPTSPPISSSPAPAPWPSATPTRRRTNGPGSPPSTCGSPRSRPTSGTRRATTRTSTPATRGSRPGRRPTARSRTPTWCSGTPWAAIMSPGPRTGRSCPSNGPGSC